MTAHRLACWTCPRATPCARPARPPADGPGDRHRRDGRKAGWTRSSCASATTPRSIPEKPERPFSHRDLVGCLRTGAERSAGSKRNPTPGQVRDGRWLVGMGVAAAFRNNLTMKSAARVRLDDKGVVTVATDMTDIGTGSYTIIAQTAAEMMGVPLDKVVVLLGDSSFPVSAGSGGQWGGNSSTAGVYAACVKLREAVAPSSAWIRHGGVRPTARSRRAARACRWPGSRADRPVGRGHHGIRRPGQDPRSSRPSAPTSSRSGSTRHRRDPRAPDAGVCAAGRILNPKSARSQVIGAMTMGVGAALMEEAWSSTSASASSSITTWPATRCRSTPTSRTRT
jgi:xanthine dehydrogenase YagR molybdenum-binding subunit